MEWLHSFNDYLSPVKFEQVRLDQIRQIEKKSRYEIGLPFHPNRTLLRKYSLLLVKLELRFLLKVLHVYRTYFPDTQGGLEEVIRQICHVTSKLGVENTVYSLSPKKVEGDVLREEARVCRSMLTFEVASCGVSFGGVLRFRELVKQADIVHYHFPWPFADVLHFISDVKKPSVLTYHSDVVRQKYLLKLYAPLMHAFLKNVDVIIPTSNNYSSSSKVLAKYSDKLEVIPIGIRETSYPILESSREEYWHQRIGGGFFLFVGVLRYYKGLHILLEAARDTAFQVVIAGKGPEEKRLKDRVRELGLENIQFLGFVSDEDKVALMSLAKAVVFPSHLRSEAFGVTLVEGLMFGNPLISCEIGTGTSYVNEDGVTGFVIPPSDPDSLRCAMLKMEGDPELVKRMGLSARERYESFFTGEVMGRAYADLYTRLLSR